MCHRGAWLATTGNAKRLACTRVNKTRYKSTANLMWRWLVNEFETTMAAAESLADLLRCAMH
eukprot:5414525-Amphidinium_carterae.1